jgi:hypothetical protein
MTAERRPTTILRALAACLTVLAIGLALPTAGGAQLDPARAVSARCAPYFVGAPCLGPIQVDYPMFGRDGGALHAIPAKLSPEVEVGKEPNGDPIIHRTLSWHTAPGVKLVAAYEVTIVTKDGKAGFHFHRIHIGTHSGHIPMTGTLQGTTHDPETETDVLLEGERTAS